ncbi:class II glutamine amidotransferase [Microbacterium sp. ARD32]|uniref:class II glutamine amidotransferase n=1 Tax=Microbacterium sp. ARD32 TaxID=2962577 RepID=UPI0028819C1A|nr:class II glutamine amidotransferase [Microbacterium sp. ARD32]MDT0156526.1 class II glutamine amidotransferase [Microbacterium sp. ARD32]
MCRLFAFVSPITASARTELGADGVESLLALARLHGDGWGRASVREPGAAPIVTRSAVSAAEDPGFDAALATPCRAAVVHLRWATAGLPVNLRNAHPFEADGVAFAHNGSIKPRDTLQAQLRPESVEALQGTTDSEMYFALIRERLAAGDALPEAAAHVAHSLRELFPLASLNALILDAEHLVVVHASATSALTEHDLARLAPVAELLPDEHNEDYFALRMRESADGTVMVGSTGVAGVGWEPLPAESVTAIRLHDRQRTTVALGSLAAAHS